jgi:hypothetical protein
MKKKYVSEDQELIRAILGKNKFLMLNINMIKKLTPNGACFLTYLLDKSEFLLKSGLIHSLNDSFYVYRRDFRENLSLSDYQQKVIETKLKDLEILSVIEQREQGETWNEYILDIYKIGELVEESIPPSKNLTHPLKKLEAE